MPRAKESADDGITIVGGTPDSGVPGAPDATIQTVGQRRKPIKVTTVAGHEIELLHAREKKFYEQARDKYLADNVFTVASDLRAIDRLLLFETQVYRWQWQLAAGMDYQLNDLETSDLTELRRSIKDTENLISQLQNDLSLTKVQRDKATTGAESVQEYIANLRLRAKEHGYRRDAQIGKAIELLNELFSVAGSYRRSNEIERRKLGLQSAEDVVDYVLDVAQPQYDAIDEAYRKNQKLWLRSL